SAIRARLECDPIDQIANQSSCLMQYPLDGLLYGYNATSFAGGFSLPDIMFGNSSSSTTVRGNTDTITCCVNGTTPIPGRAIIGYWSAMQHSRTQYDFPYADRN